MPALVFSRLQVVCSKLARAQFRLLAQVHITFLLAAWELVRTRNVLRPSVPKWQSLNQDHAWPLFELGIASVIESLMS